MKSILLFSLLIFLLTPATGIRAEVLAADGTAQATAALHPSGKKQHKPGLFKKFRAIKTLKKLVHEQSLKGEKANDMAITALWIFAASLVFGALSSTLPLFSYLSLIGLIVSNTLAIIILTRGDKGKSRAIARVIVITSLILAILALLAFFLVLLLLVSIFG